MPRNGSGVFSAPVGTYATTQTEIESAKYNAFVQDVVDDLNLARPIVAGGTGATTVNAARGNLGILPKLATLSAFASDAQFKYTSGYGSVASGDVIQTEEDGLSLKVLSSGAATYDHINANGVKANLVSTVANLPNSIAAPYVTKTARFHKVFGVLRQDTADRTRWRFLDDTAHKPLGFDSTFPLFAQDGTTLISPKAAGNNLLVFWKKRTDDWQATMSPTASYDLVGNCLVTADEILTKDWGVALGAQVTRTGITIQGSMHKTRHMRIYWSGSAWTVTSDSLQSFGTVTTSYDNGTGILTVTHDWLPGQDLRIETDPRSGLVALPHLPFRREIVSDTSFTVQFRDYAGAIITGAPTTAMSLRATKTYNGPLYLDGTNGFDAMPWSTSDSGNIWISGEMWEAV